MKYFFTSKGIPVILTEISVKTQYLKDSKYIREYFYFTFSLANEIKGIMACLLDTSNSNETAQIVGKFNYNYYDRKNNKWYDEVIQKIFLIISNKKYIKPSQFYKNKNTLTSYKEQNTAIYSTISGKKPLKIFINAKIKGKIKNFSFNIFCDQFNMINDKYVEYKIEHSKKEYDGTYSYILDVSDKKIVILYYIFIQIITQLKLTFKNFIDKGELNYKIIISNFIS